MKQLRDLQKLPYDKRQPEMALSGGSCQSGSCNRGDF